ncbi:MAG: hypothetical protein AAF717_16740 [Bacteroidota bacterium]
MKAFIALVIFLLLFNIRGYSQQSDAGRNYIGLSAQFYPAGFIPTGNLEHFLNEKASVVFRLGFNFTDRQDFSDVNNTEEGEGFGGSFGYRMYFPLAKGKIIAGLNTDIWSLNIDWTDTLNEAETAGSTYILVLQPWLEGGYFLPIRNSKSEVGITLGFGREINVITSGDEVEQGFIGSVSLQYKFSL